MCMQSLSELKKAYGEILVHTSKEAAARVMESESKARRFEHELIVAKEEGIQMMVRFKKMMEAKVYILIGITQFAFFLFDFYDQLS